MSQNASRFSNRTDRKSKRIDKHLERELRGVQQESLSNTNSNEKYNLNWFKPCGRQQEIVDAVGDYLMYEGELDIIKKRNLNEMDS